MKELVKSLHRHQFFTLSSGVVAAQVLSLAFMPILTRLYPVESFGYFAIYIATTNLIGVFSTLRLEFTIPIATDEAESNQLSSITCAMSLAAGLVMGLVFAFPRVRALLPSMTQDYGPWLMIAASATLIGWIQVTTQRIVRNGRLKYTAIRHIVDKGAFLILALAGAKFGYQASGLIAAQVVGNLLSVVVLFAGCGWRPGFNFQAARKLAKKYSDFPKLNTTSMALQIVATQLPIMLYSRFFGAEALGFLNLAQRLAEAPNTIVGSALGTVYYRRILEAKRGQFRRIYLRTLLWSVLGFVLPAALVSFYAGPIIKFVFGIRWDPSVPYFLALVPLTVTRLSYVLQQTLTIVLRRLDLDLNVSAMVLVAQGTGLIIGIAMFSTLLGPVMLASTLTAGVYLISLVLLFRALTRSAA